MEWWQSPDDCGSPDLFVQPHQHRQLVVAKTRFGSHEHVNATALRSWTSRTPSFAALATAEPFATLEETGHWKEPLDPSLGGFTAAAFGSSRSRGELERRASERRRNWGTLGISWLVKNSFAAWQIETRRRRVTSLVSRDSLHTHRREPCDQDNLVTELRHRLARLANGKLEVGVPKMVAGPRGSSLFERAALHQAFTSFCLAVCASNASRYALELEEQHKKTEKECQLLEEAWRIQMSEARQRFRSAVRERAHCQAHVHFAVWKQGAMYQVFSAWSCFHAREDSKQKLHAAEQAHACWFDARLRCEEVLLVSLGDRESKCTCFCAWANELQRSRLENVCTEQVSAVEQELYLQQQLSQERTAQLEDRLQDLNRAVGFQLNAAKEQSFAAASEFEVAEADHVLALCSCRALAVSVASTCRSRHLLSSVFGRWSTACRAALAEHAWALQLHAAEQQWRQQLNQADAERLRLDDVRAELGAKLCHAKHVASLLVECSHRCIFLHVVWVAWHHECTVTASAMKCEKLEAISSFAQMLLYKTQLQATLEFVFLRWVAIHTSLRHTEHLAFADTQAALAAQLRSALNIRMRAAIEAHTALSRRHLVFKTFAEWHQLQGQAAHQVQQERLGAEVSLAAKLRAREDILMQRAMKVGSGHCLAALFIIWKEWIAKIGQLEKQLAKGVEEQQMQLQDKGMRIAQLEELLATGVEERQLQLQEKGLRIAQLEELLATGTEEQQLQFQEKRMRIAQLEELLATGFEEQQMQLQEKGMRIAQLEELLATGFEEQQIHLQEKGMRIAQLEELLATGVEEQHARLHEKGMRIAQLEELLEKNVEEQMQLQEKGTKIAQLEELLAKNVEDQQELRIRMQRAATRLQAWITGRLTSTDQVGHRLTFNSWSLYASRQRCWRERRNRLDVAERFLDLHSPAHRYTFNAWRCYIQWQKRWRQRRHKLLLAERFLGLHVAAYRYSFSAWSLQVCRQRRVRNRGCDSLTAENLSDQHVVAKTFSAWLMASRIAGCKNRHLADICRLRHRIALLRCEHCDFTYTHIAFSNWRWEASKALLEFRIVQIWDLLHSSRVLAAESRQRLVRRLWLSELCMLVRTTLMFWRRSLEDSNNSLSCSHLRCVISELMQESASLNHMHLLGPASPTASNC